MSHVNTLKKLIAKINKCDFLANLANKFVEAALNAIRTKVDIVSLPFSNVITKKKKTLDFITLSFIPILLSLFLLSKSFCHDLNTVLRKFWWDSCQN